MYKLFLSEMQRLWVKKSTRLCFLAIPFIIYASGKYYLKTNNTVSQTSPQFTSFYNFPAAAIQEQLITIFNMVVILLIVLAVTQEYQSGEIRMVLIRPIKIVNVFISKYLVILTTILFFLIFYLICSYLIGYFMFPKLKFAAVFYHKNTFNVLQLLIYSIRYYLIAFLTLAAVASVIFFISTISKSVIIALGVSIFFLLCSISYPVVLQILFMNEGVLLTKLQMLSLTQIQYKGIAIMLGMNNNLFFYNLIVLFSYLFIFLFLCYFIYSKKDQFV